MADAVAVFWTERTGWAGRSLRRYLIDDRCEQLCVDGKPYHRANAWIEGRWPLALTDDGFIALIDPDEYADHPAWPTVCDDCGWVLPDTVIRHVAQHPLYASADGHEWAQGDLPAGAMFDADWLPDNWKGADGIGLTVVLP